MSIWNSPHIPWDGPGHWFVWLIVAVIGAIAGHVIERAYKRWRSS